MYAAFSRSPPALGRDTILHELWEYEWVPQFFRVPFRVPLIRIIVFGWFLLGSSHFGGSYHMAMENTTHLLFWELVYPCPCTIITGKPSTFSCPGSLHITSSKCSQQDQDFGHATPPFSKTSNLLQAVQDLFLLAGLATALQGRI